MDVDLRKWKRRYQWYWRHRGFLQGAVAGLLVALFAWALWGRVYGGIPLVAALLGAWWQEYRHQNEHRFIDALDRQAGLEQQLLALYESQGREENPFLRPLARRIDAHLRPMLGAEVFPFHWWPESVIILFLVAALGAGLLLPDQSSIGLLTYSDGGPAAVEESDSQELSPYEDEMALEADLSPSSPTMEGESLDEVPPEPQWSQSSQDYAVARDRASRLVEEFVRELPASSEQVTETWTAESAQAPSDDGASAEPDQERDLQEDGDEIGLHIDGMEPDADEAEGDEDLEGGGMASDFPGDDVPESEEGNGEGSGRQQEEVQDPNEMDPQQAPSGDTSPEGPTDDSTGAEGGAGTAEGGLGTEDTSDLVPEGGEFFDAQLEGSPRDDDWLLFIMEELGTLDPDMESGTIEQRMLNYRQELMNQAEREEIPLRYRDWIRDYFSLISAN